MTIRELINEYRNKLVDASSLSPDVASRTLVELTALIGNLNEEILKRKIAFNDKKLAYMIEIKSVAKAQVMAETSPEYIAYEEVKMSLDLMKEMIRGLKYYLRSQEDEYKLSKNL
ncbi:hypothetical protein M0R04_12955 [Candidatus Dojkabacteria bacterium]|jgi:hypothetical protein|nr:hypothetical protein [Candidatus Dojkabacteria bacterium]